MEEKSLAVDLGTEHGLQIDPSLNEFSKEVTEAYRQVTGDKETQVGRKLIKRALEAVSLLEDTTSAENNKQSASGVRTLSDEIMQCRYVEQRGEEKRAHKKHNTYPVRIPWETKELIKALCIARKVGRHKEEELAQDTLEWLAKEIGDRPAEGIGSSYICNQLLREEVFREALVAQLKKNVDVRIETIYRQLDGKHADESLSVLQRVIPSLDWLVVGLKYDKERREEDWETHDSQSDQGRSHECDPKKMYGKNWALRWFNRAYKRLISVRPEMKNLGYAEKMYFKIGDGDSGIAEYLKAVFGSEKPTPIDAKQLEMHYNTYLLNKSKCAENREVKEFIKQYVPLAEYVKTIEDWETVAERVKFDLYKYVRDMFEDIDQRTPMPYNYTHFKIEEGNSAFISAACVNAHDQIRARLSDAVRLLYEKSYHTLFFWDKRAKSYVGMAQKSKDVLLAWEVRANKERSRLAKANEDIPLLAEENGEQRIWCFAREYYAFLEKMKWVESEGNKKNDQNKGKKHDVNETKESLHKQLYNQINALVRSTRKNPDPTKRILATGLLLEKESQLVAIKMADEAIEEIRETYQMMRDTYASSKK